MSAERPMTSAEAADYLGIAVGTLHNWRYYGRGPRALRAGSRLRYRRSDLDAWLESQAHNDTRSHLRSVS